MIESFWNLLILSISYIILIHNITSEIEIGKIFEIFFKIFFFCILNCHINPASKHCKTYNDSRKYDFLRSSSFLLKLTRVEDDLWPLNIIWFFSLAILILFFSANIWVSKKLKIFEIKISIPKIEITTQYVTIQIKPVLKNTIYIYIYISTV